MTKKSDRPSNAAQMASPAYRLAALDQDYLLSDALRGIRFHLEYEKAEQSLRAWGVQSTIVVFGSARVTEDGAGEHGRWYCMARSFAEIASRNGGALWTKNTMGKEKTLSPQAAAAALWRPLTGAPMMPVLRRSGLISACPFEQEPNPYSTPELTFQFHYFAMRKMHFAMRAAALVVFPGGFGTFDELFELPDAGADPQGARIADCAL